MAEDKEWDKIRKTKQSKLYVALPDGTLLQGKNGIETFLMFIEEMGIERVRNLNFQYGEENFILDYQPEDNRYRELSGWYVFTGHRGVARAKFIRAIANALDEKVVVNWDK